MEELATQAAEISAVETGAPVESAHVEVSGQEASNMGTEPAQYSEEALKVLNGTFGGDVEKALQGYRNLKSQYDKHYGSFTGAPEDGYSLDAPAEWADKGYKIDSENPVLQKFNETAAEMQLSNEGYQKIMGLMGEYEIGKIEQMNQAADQYCQSQLESLSDEEVGAFQKAIDKAQALPGVDSELLMHHLSNVHDADSIKLITSLVSAVIPTSLPDSHEPAKGSEADFDADIVKWMSMTEGKHKAAFKRELDARMRAYYGE